MTIADKNIREEWTADEGPAHVTATLFLEQGSSAVHKIQFGGYITIDPSGAITSEMLIAARDALAEVLLGFQSKYGDTPPPP
jgi:hypothetical protein